MPKLDSHRVKVMSFLFLSVLLVGVAVWQYYALEQTPPTQEFVRQQDRALLHDEKTKISPESENRILAALLRLGEGRDPVVIARVQDWIETPSESLRAHMARSLKAFYDTDERVPALLRRLFEVGGEGVKRKVIDSIGAMASEARLKHLEEIISAPSVDERLQFRAYAQIGESQRSLLTEESRRAHADNIQSKAQNVLTAQQAGPEELRDLLSALQSFGVEATPELRTSVDKNMDRLGPSLPPNTKALVKSWENPKHD